MERFSGSHSDRRRDMRTPSYSLNKTKSKTVEKTKFPESQEIQTVSVFWKIYIVCIVG
jgi:hypothetical protein